LGGRDWDRLIESYLYEAFYRETRREIPDDMGFEIQQKALQAKFELSEREQTVVTMTGEDGDCIVPLRRSAPPAGEDDEDFEFDLDRPFCFEERATDLLTQCQAICERVRAKAGICRWVDVDEIILAGGACRMPMIPKMLDQLYAPKRVRTSLEGFSYDTAIAIGAALYGHHHARVRDVVPKTYGVKYLRAGRLVIDHFIHKNTPLPCSAERETHAYADAVLEVHEGESQAPDECRLVGHLALQNPQGRVRVRLLVEEHGLIEAAATWPGTDRWMKRTITDQYGPEWLDELRRRLSSIIIRA
jgi:molecular chaperone DnaK (HSP70)